MSGVQSIQRAFALLRVLAVGQAGVTDLAERAELPKSTVARLLSALETEGAVEQVEAGGEYRLGDGLIDLAGAAAPGRNLIAAARPHLIELMDATGESSGIAILAGTEAMYLDDVESEEEVQVRGLTGDTVPLNVVPSGLVLLADQPESFVDDYLSQPLTGTTDNSMTDPAKLRARLENIRRDGHSWAYAEFDASINSVAAPVRDESGSVLAAIHVHGPAYRFPENGQADAIADLVKAAADNLSAQLN
ncbi:MAG: IclR family transcriptional regulator [Acidimicrobiales bacterium]